MTARRLDGYMALNGNCGNFFAIANGRAGEPGCYDIDIFILYGSPGRANGHLCLGVISTVPGSADSSSIASPIIIAALCNDRCMVTDHDLPCRAARIVTARPISASTADGRAI